MTDSFWHQLFTNSFLQTALFAGFAAAFAGGIIGSYAVAKRIVFVSGSVSHGVVGGLGLFVFLGYFTKMSIFIPLLGALLSALFFAFLMGWVHLKYRERDDSIIAALWSLGMALGIIFIAIVPGSNAELMNFLFGNLLFASHEDIEILILLDGFILLVCLLCHKRFLAISFDETQSYLQGLNVRALYFLLLAMVAVTIVLMIQIIGAILIISMLCLPAAIANIFSSKLSKMIYLSVLFSFVFTFVGIYLSYTFNWPPGATIALITTIVYFLSLPLKARSV